MPQCPHCLSEVTFEKIMEKKVRTALRIKEGQRKAAASGKHVGRAKTYDRERIKELIREGKTTYEICEIVGCSSWPVQLARREMYIQSKEVPYAKEKSSSDNN